MAIVNDQAGEVIRKAAMLDGGTGTDYRLHIEHLGPQTASVTRVASSATTVTLLAANAARKVYYLFNDSNRSAYVKFGAGASATDFTLKMAPGAFWENQEHAFRGVITAVWDQANGAMQVTES
jgi:hypothetical protein